MIEIWGRQSSINVQKVMWLAAELGIAVRRHDAGGAYGGVDTPEFAAMNPNRLVPVLRHGELVIWESNTILRYLASRAGDDTFWPSDPGRRALLDRWLDWAAATLGPQFTVLFWAIIRTRAQDRDAAVIEKAQQIVAQRFQLLERELAGKGYLGGDTFTMADIAAGAAAYRWFAMPIGRPRLPNVEAWYNRLTERPAYRHNVMIPII